MAEMRFTKEHEWVRDDGAGMVTVGITAYAQEQLGDVVFVDLPAVGKKLQQGSEAGTIESVKTAAELYAPVDGEVVETNARLKDEPALVNSSPTDDGWFVKLKSANKVQLATLMTAAQYKSYCDGLH
ncbi:MAG: glycine cleavage system protein GcvH [Alphaproteobacteria bacterium]|nr:glycine cleavage system protein GcvH [Alphaproteobacteria bacterium]